MGFLPSCKDTTPYAKPSPKPEPANAKDKEVPGANFWLLPMVWPTEYQEVCPIPNHLQGSVQAHEPAQGNREQAQGNWLCTAAKAKPEKRLFSETDTPAPALHVYHLTYKVPNH